MRPLILLALLLATPLPALAADPGDASVEASEHAAPASVLEHRLDVKAQGTSTIITQTWTVRVDDPSAASSGLPAPAGMDGAAVNGAKIVEDVALFPPDTAPGTTFAFTHTSRQGRRASASFSPVPDLPAEQVSARLSASGLGLWTDEEANVSMSGSVATIEWPSGTSASRELVWSTWGSWSRAGEAIGATVDEKMAPSSALGRDLASGLTGLRPRTILSRVDELVRHDPVDGTWTNARTADEIARSGHGTTTERGVLLINLLRLAGFDAHPALYAPAGTFPDAPLTLPAPHLYTKPAVVIFEDGQAPAILDPASPLVVPPALPSSLRGARLWLEGDTPMPVGEDTLFSGRVVVSGQVIASEDGSATISASITADGTAAEDLRARLGPIEPEQREEILMRLLQVAYPAVDRFSLDTSGLERLDRPIRIQVGGHVPSTMEPLGPGLTGQIHPVFAPAIAAWMPGETEVVEELAFRRPKHVLPLSVHPDTGTHTREVSLASTLEIEGERMILSTRASRPNTATRPIAEARAEEALHDRAHEGAKVLFFPWPTPEVSKEVRAGVDGLSPVEAQMLEALAWWREPEERRARKVLKRVMKDASVEEIAAAIVTYGDRNNPLPWEALLEEASPQDRMVCARGLAAQGQRDVAWRKAIALADHSDPEVALEAKLLLAQTQPAARPDEAEDREGHLAWREPKALLDEVLELATSQGHDDARAVALETLAIQALERGDADAAVGHLDARLALGEESWLTALRAEARARQGASPGEVRRLLDEAGELDHRGALHASHALAHAGDAVGALEWAQVSARLDHADPARWDLVADGALAVGRLPMAVDAARYASDAAPSDRSRAARLSHLAALAGNRDLAQTAARRAGSKATDVRVPDDLASRTALAEPHELWAVLVHHDEQTKASPNQLLVRAQLALDAGDASAAARDGALLASRHDDPRGEALAFAASVGRVYGSALHQAIDADSRRHPAVIRAQLEYALVTGDGDAAGDARALPDDLAATSLVTFAKDGSAEGWTGGTDPKLSVPGMTRNALLGRADGVAAVSDPGRATAVVRHVGPDLLPPPLSLLYTPRDRALTARDDGTTVTRVDGGALPLHVAARTRDGVTTLGLGFTEAAALRALDHAL